MAKATVNALQRLRRPEEVAQTRGLEIWRVLPYRLKPEPEPETEPDTPDAEPQAADAEPTTAEAETVDTPSPLGVPLVAERITEDEAVLEPATAVAETVDETPAEAEPAQEEPADAEA
jgi:hypothetical protein